MRTLALFITCTFFFQGISLAQKEASHWYFGYSGGLDFSSGAPVYNTASSQFVSEGCSSISDSAGNLLFYTDGITVTNRNHSTMANGTGLMGNSDATQSALIVKLPGSSTFYYIFTVTNEANPDGVRYSIVDMSQNGGLGSVVSKNGLIWTPSSEKLTATRHANGTDVWIITHDWNSDAFRSFLLTPGGILPGFVISHCGIVHDGSTWNTNGYLKVSSNGKKIAVAVCHYINKFEVFDFDNLTGMVSNVISFPSYPATIGAYGVEFSRDCTKLYGSMLIPPTIYQFDLCAGSAADIINSATIIGTDNQWICALQLGPDGKIYVARDSNDSLGVINNPNAAGISCNYSNNGVYLGSNASGLGLPSFESSLFGLINYHGQCVNDSTLFFITDTNNVDSVLWNFDDPASGLDNISRQFNPLHLFTATGNYNVQVIRFGNGVAMDTTIFCLQIIACSVLTPAVSMDKKILIAPNPGTGIFDVFVKEINCDNTHLEIYDYTGKKVFMSSEKYFGQDLKIQIDLSMLNPGIYFLKINGEKFTACERIILE